ncbi:MAG: TonB-dependent receptor [Dysgonamonadaceae bacterium]|nr:TonB-dependent receptor [Dysgonamonadaceae bacterium]
MKKVFLALIVLFFLHATQIWAQAEPDSLSNVQLDEIVVSATRAGKNTPLSYSNITEAQLKKENAATNIPVLLQTLPSLVAVTEGGTGVGNTSLRIRGTDATRINVTLNGMPLNNPETQEVYWVNLPDLSSSLQSVQVQRGVGTSTNGSAAFGASMSLKTIGASSDAYGAASTSVGSYNTFSSSLAAGTGLLNNGFAVDARYSKVLSDGYIRNGKVDHSNLFLSLSHYSVKQLLRINYINGIQHTGITWNGTSPEQIEEFGRRFNSAGAYYDSANNLRFYDNDTDNYYSHILQLMFNRELTRKLSLNVNLNYTNGYGYYENYRSGSDWKKGDKYEKYGLENQEVDGVEYKNSHMVRQKLLANDFYVANFSFNYNLNPLQLVFGGFWSDFDGSHYGKLPWIKYNQNIPENYEWYRNKGVKKEISFFTKAEYQLNDKISLYGDVQYRYIDYRMEGTDDDMADLTSNHYYSFMNPKGGVFFKPNDNNQFYASLAVGQREPLRTDLKDAVKFGGTKAIEPEKMIDYELGYRYKNNQGTQLAANLYYMDYNNQMVQTGKLSSSGYKIMENVKDSYRAGIELEAQVPLSRFFRIDANATFSKNIIKDYTAYYDVYDQYYDKVIRQDSEEFDKTDISFSPNGIGMVSITYTPLQNLSFNLMRKYVGKQYYDNTSNNENSLSEYVITNFAAGYTFNKSKFGNIDLQFMINNLFDKEYIANAWVSADRLSDGTEYVYKGLFPQATRNFMARVTVRF